MEDENKNLENLINHAEEYIKTRQELTQHILTEKMVVMSSSMISGLILLFLFIIALIFLSVAVAIFISKTMNNEYAGFVAVGGFYFLLALLLAVMKEKWMNRPLMNRMIQNIYREN